MKNSKLPSFLLAIVFSYASSTSYAQNTTDEEWAYLTRGLTTTFSQGLDIKKGYLTDNKTEHSIGSYTVIFLDLIREGDKSLAGTYISFYSGVSGRRYVYAIQAPTWAQDGSYNFSTRLYSQMREDGLDGPASSAIAAAIAERYMRLYLSTKK